jgi:hypothetical protein
MFIHGTGKYHGSKIDRGVRYPPNSEHHRMRAAESKLM